MAWTLQNCKKNFDLSYASCIQPQKQLGRVHSWACCLQLLCLLTTTQLQLSVAELHLSNTSVKSFLQQHAAGDEACISMELQYLSPWNGVNLSAARQHSNGHKHNILAMCQVSGMHVSCSVQQAAAYKQPGMPNINLICYHTMCHTMCQCQSVTLSAGLSVSQFVGQSVSHAAVSQPAG